MSMMIGVACSLGLVSMRVTPSMRSGISSSAGSGIGAFLLNRRNLVNSNGVNLLSGEEWRERRDLIRGALDADHCRAVDVECAAHRGGESVGVADVHGRQAREHGSQAGTEPAGPKSVVAV